jgi:Gas vesicle protein
MQKVYGYEPDGKNLQDTLDRVLDKGIVLDASLRYAASIDLVRTNTHLVAEPDDEDDFEGNQKQDDPTMPH